MTLFAKRQTAAQLRVDRFILQHTLGREFRVVALRVDGDILYRLDEQTARGQYPITDPMSARELAQWLDGAKWVSRHPKEV